MKNKILLFSIFCLPLFLSAQENDLLSILGEDKTTEYAEAAFKTNRVINGHSIENTAEGVLDFKIQHRFGMLNQGWNDLWGLDDAMVRIGFDYGLTDQFNIGIGRTGFDKIYDGFLKYKFLRQSTGEKHMPVTAAVLGSVDFIGSKVNPDPEGRTSSRWAYTTQLIVGRKFSEGLTLQIAPTFVHRNLVPSDAENNILLLGFSGRQKLTRRVTVNFEFYLANKEDFGTDLQTDFHNSFSLGFDIETGGHVFQLHFTNSTSMAHTQFLTATRGDWGDGGIHFGFNISRVFTVKDKKAKH